MNKETGQRGETDSICRGKVGCSLALQPSLLNTLIYRVESGQQEGERRGDADREGACREGERDRQKEREQPDH